MRLSLTALAALAAAAVAVPVSPAAQGAGADGYRQTLKATGTYAGTDCATTDLAGRSGVVTTSWTPSLDVSLRTLLASAEGADWDLAVFDAKTGKRVGGSGGVNPTEGVPSFA